MQYENAAGTLEGKRRSYARYTLNANAQARSGAPRFLHSVVSEKIRQARLVSVRSEAQSLEKTGPGVTSVVSS